MEKKFDAIVLGAGIAGIGAALGLAKLQKRVLVVYRHAMKGEASPAAGGILDPLLELSPAHPMLGITLEAFRRYPALIREVEKATEKKAGYQKTGLLYLAKNKEEVKGLKSRYAWQRKTGISLRLVRRDWLFKKVPHLSKQAALGLYYPEISRIQPRKWLAALFDFSKRKGIRFFPIKNEKVSPILSGDRWVGLRIHHRSFQAPVTILATGSWAGTVFKRRMKIPVRPARGQMMVLKSRRNLTSTILHSLDGNYIVPWGKKEYLIGSTVEFVGFKPHPTAQGLRLIFEKAVGILPELKAAKPKESWAGLRPCSKDQKPLIGPARIKGLYLATGYFRSGILIGCHAGDLLARGIVTGKWARALGPFSPSRLGV